MTLNDLEPAPKNGFSVFLQSSAAAHILSVNGTEMAEDRQKQRANNFLHQSLNVDFTSSSFDTPVLEGPAYANVKKGYYTIVWVL